MKKNKMIKRKAKMPVIKAAAKKTIRKTAAKKPAGKSAAKRPADSGLFGYPRVQIQDINVQLMKWSFSQMKFVGMGKSPSVQNVAIN